MWAVRPLIQHEPATWCRVSVVVCCHRPSEGSRAHVPDGIARQSRTISARQRRSLCVVHWHAAMI